MLHFPYMTRRAVPGAMTQRVWREDCSGCQSPGGPPKLLPGSSAVASRWKNPFRFTPLP